MNRFLHQAAWNRGGDNNVSSSSPSFPSSCLILLATFLAALKTGGKIMLWCFKVALLDDQKSLLSQLQRFMDLVSKTAVSACLHKIHTDSKINCVCLGCLSVYPCFLPLERSQMRSVISDKILLQCCRHANLNLFI